MADDQWVRWIDGERWVSAHTLYRTDIYAHASVGELLLHFDKVAKEEAKEANRAEQQKVARARASANRKRLADSKELAWDALREYCTRLKGGGVDSPPAVTSRILRDRAKQSTAVIDTADIGEVANG